LSPERHPAFKIDRLPVDIDELVVGQNARGLGRAAGAGTAYDY